MQDSTSQAAGRQLTANEIVGRLQSLFKRILAGNPFYLASAGLLLYGINQLTTDSQFVGAAFPLLRFNFSALVLYEIMLVGTAILLIRRRIWYDALLLFGLANLFVIVPFSLISRAVFLSSHLALAMTICGAALAVAKFWAFKRYAPELNLPRRLLFFGALLLLINASAPILFKRIAFNPDEIGRRLNFIWEFLLPALAALGIFLPRQVKRGDTPGGEKWLPAAVYFGWVIVTGCHFGGIGYSNSYVWNVSLLVPIAWVTAWTAYVRIADFIPRPNRLAQQILSSVPLLLPLLAIGSERIFLLFAALNLLIYALLLIRKDRNIFSLVRLLGAVTILWSNLPAPWVSYLLPEVGRPEWAMLSIVVCFYWLIFLSRNPRVSMFAALGLIGLSCFFAPQISACAVQVALGVLLLHSLRWDDRAHKGATTLRFLAVVIWGLFSWSMLFDSAHPQSLLPDFFASAFLVAYLLRAMIYRHWNHRILPIIASALLLSEPTTTLAGWLNRETPGILAIVGSFLLFALGSIAAFSKPKWWRSDPNR